MHMTSLFDICVYFIAKNVDLLESLCGFPDSVGKTIFQHAVNKGCFTDARLKCHVLKIFSDAYGDFGFLDSLSLQGCHLLLNDIEVNTESTWAFQSLKQLDLRGCGLGDEHEVLLYLGNLHSLQILGIAENSLTDSGIRRLTARARMFREKGSRLECLDLSDNRCVSIKSLEFLHSFKALSVLRVSNTSISPESLSRSVLSDAWSVRNCTGCLSSFNISTQGWAADVIENWKKLYTGPKECDRMASVHSSSQREAHTIVQDVKMFYGKRKPLKSQESCALQQEKKHPEVLLFSQAFSCQHGSHSEHLHKECANRVKLNPCSKENSWASPSSQSHFTSLSKKELKYSIHSKSSKNQSNAKRRLSSVDIDKQNTKVWNSTSSGAVTFARNSVPASSFRKKQRIAGSSEIGSNSSRNGKLCAQSSSNTREDMEGNLLSQYSQSEVVSEAKTKKLSLLEHLANYPT